MILFSIGKNDTLTLLCGGVPIDGKFVFQNLEVTNFVVMNFVVTNFVVTNSVVTNIAVTMYNQKPLHLAGKTGT